MVLRVKIQSIASVGMSRKIFIVLRLFAAENTGLPYIYFYKPRSKKRFG